ncbi:MAG: hypothetical protein R3F56_04345 [Planctomycetota bacterium]
MDERAELRALAEAPEVRAAMVEFDHVHELCAHERALFAAVAAPAEAAEEADEGFARLAAAGARAESDLRGRLLHPALHVAGRRRFLRVWLAVPLVAAAAFLLAYTLGAFTAPPALHQEAPRDERAGGVVAGILLAPHLSAADRCLEWSPVWHARTYEVAVFDTGGKVLLQRPLEQARSTRWELTEEQIATLRAKGDLRLRVRALDGSGLVVGSTGDLPLQVQ